jgi:hypothetical protein
MALVDLPALDLQTLIKKLDDKLKNENIIRCCKRNCKYVYNEECIIEESIIHILYNLHLLKYKLSKNQFDKIINNRYLGTFLIDFSNFTYYNEAINLIFETYTPQTAIMTQILNRYKSDINYKILLENQKNVFYVIKLLFDKNYKWHTAHKKRLCDLGLIVRLKPADIKKITIKDFENIFANNVRNDIKYVLYLIKLVIESKKNIFNNNTTCINLFLSNTNFKNIPMFKENNVDINNLVLKICELIKFLVANGSIITKDAICGFINKYQNYMATGSNYNYSNINATKYIFYTLIDHSILNIDDAKDIYASIHNINLLHYEKFYIADKYGFVTENVIKEVYNYYEGIMLTIHNDMINKYCDKEKTTTINSITYYYSTEVFVLKLANKIDINKIIQRNNINNKNNNNNVGVIHLLDIFKYHNIQLGTKMMAHAISINDVTTYEKIKSIGIYPDDKCLKMALYNNNNNNNDNTLFLDDILQKDNKLTSKSMEYAIRYENQEIYKRLESLKIYPNEKCLEIAIFTQDINIVRNILNYKIQPTYNAVKNIFGRDNCCTCEDRMYLLELLLQYGLKFDKKIMKIAIKNNILLNDLSRFLNMVPIDNTIYYYLNVYERVGFGYNLYKNLLNIYAEHFDNDLKNKHILRQKFKNINMSITEAMELVKHNKIDGYCFINSIQNPKVHEYLSSLYQTPVFGVEHYNCSNIMNKKSYKYFINKLYGSVDNYIEVLNSIL